MALSILPRGTGEVVFGVTAVKDSFIVVGPGYPTELHLLKLLVKVFGAFHRTFAATAVRRRRLPVRRG